MQDSANISPVSGSHRFVILDALRGFALLGICMANFPEFSLYSFLDTDTRVNMPTQIADLITAYFLNIFIDGKFYTIFSLLFGIGFSIIITNVMKRGGNGFKVFYRRMFVLLIIGFLHLMLVWSGDILMLYALVGMTLPLFTKLRDKILHMIALFLLFLPVVIDSICEAAHISLSGWIVDWQWRYCDKYGITEDNFAYWLRDARNYDDVFKFLIQGAIVRLQEFVDGNRYFKVLGLFLIGYVIGRNRLFANIDEYKDKLKQICYIGIGVGLPLSVFYGWDAINGKPFGNGAHSLIYFVSVYLLSFGYVSCFCLLYMKCKEWYLWKILSYPGKMALTNYIGQSFFGMVIFYGIGFGFGAGMGLVFVEIIVVMVFLVEILYSFGWLSWFRFGPLEWIWRCLTYGKIFPLRK